ncbi:hypothetical protein SAY87_022862 [Trapa incisa]|uniref:Uncharacterized protein n=1 Tax=Trapa incisa TaxID=236973 RepID=A0AAN7K4H3_9MYRT|nr:hypothetical protein SAY87_022862 [Trapa incisa]
MAFTATAISFPDPRQASIDGACSESKLPSPNQDHLPSEPSFEQQQPSPKFKSSAMLSRWSRARSIRSGRMLDRLAQNDKLMEPDLGSPQALSPGCASPVSNRYAWFGRSRSDVSEATAAKQIYMVSDGTGWTAEHSVKAALGQFDHSLVDRKCPVNTHLFSGIDDGDKLMEVIKQAAKEDAMLVYTLADPSMVESAKQACSLWEIPSADVLGPITEAVASHLGVTPSGLPRGARGRHVPLTEEYFKRIEAVEFTIKQDDGALPQNLRKADIVLAGVSRTGKTPLSIYLAQKGYKVANVPIVMGVGLPKTLFEVDPEKVFGMTINPVVLQTIRRVRARNLGFGVEAGSNYFDMDYVREELDFAGKVFAQNPIWPVIEVTGKAIEETAAVVLRLYHDRKQKCSMPRISKRY